VKKLENIIKTERNERKREQEFMKKKIKKLEKIIKELRVKIQRKERIAKKVNISMNKEKMQEVNDEINTRDNFEENPENLKFKEYLINNYEYGNLCFDVFIGLKDKVEYLVYNNKNINKIEIMRISDKNIIKSFGGNENPIKLIKYFKKNNNEDYILSCENKLIIIWDIQKNFYSKRIEIKNNAYIFDILLFNNINKNYIVISNIKKDSFSSLYEVKDVKVELIRKIYGTQENMTRFMILWKYQNKYYLIECCNNGKISINNLFEDETYINFETKDAIYDYGYIYNQNYLCTSDLNHNYITIWDLKNKTISKQIELGNIYGGKMITWNNKYTIIGCSGCFAIIDIEEGKMEKIIKLNENVDFLKGVKKIKINQIESLVISDNNNI
jgi:WD40 repeat protein